jgi:hypothetical protein
MATKDTLFTVAGITTHSRADVTVTKVRFGTDFIRMIKMLNSSKKIGVSYNFGGRDDGFLDPVRVSMIELPHGMLKVDAIKFLQSHPDFQSAEDQAMLLDAVTDRTPKAPKERKVKAPKVAKTELSLDSIKSRAKKTATVADVLAAVTE